MLIIFYNRSLRTVMARAAARVYDDVSGTIQRGAAAMMDTQAGKSAAEIAAQLERWLNSRERLKTLREDVMQLDEPILPFKTNYVRNGAIHGGNSAGMLRWYAEARPDQPANAVPPASTETS